MIVFFKYYLKNVLQHKAAIKDKDLCNSARIQQ